MYNPMDEYIKVLKNILLRRKIIKWAMIRRHSKKLITTSKYEDIVVPFMYLNTVYANINLLEEEHILTILEFLKSPNLKEVELVEKIVCSYCDTYYKRDLPESVTNLFKQRPNIETIYQKNWWKY